MRYIIKITEKNIRTTTIAISIMNKKVPRENSIFHVWYVCLQATLRLNFSRIDVVTKQVCIVVQHIALLERIAKNIPQEMSEYSYITLFTVVAFISTLYIFFYPVTSSSGKNRVQ